MSQISAKIVAHSKDKKGNELITYELVFPRYILAEFNTHRAFSRNSASSRAIPFKKMVELIRNNPFIPVAWQKDHAGMQGTEYITDKDDIKRCLHYWIRTKNHAIETAQHLNNIGATKQLCNRLLEPFMWHKVIMTTSKEGLDNFFNLRCPSYKINEKIKTQSRKSFMMVINDHNKANYIDWTLVDWLKINESDAEIHISLLAEAMLDAYYSSSHIELSENEYHIPFSNDMTFLELTKDLSLEDKIKVSIGMCARVSYTTISDNNSKITAQTYINIYNKMVDAEPFHASPFEHVARAMTEDEYERFIRGDISLQEWLAIEYRESIKGWCRNFKGFVQERYRIEQLNYSKC